jgi:hypothetical protein
MVMVASVDLAGLVVQEVVETVALAMVALAMVGQSCSRWIRT